jgi:hypothetical protein
MLIGGAPMHDSASDRMLFDALSEWSRRGLLDPETLARLRSDLESRIHRPRADPGDVVAAGALDVPAVPAASVHAPPLETPPTGHHARADAPRVEPAPVVPEDEDEDLEAVVHELDTPDAWAGGGLARLARHAPSGERLGWFVGVLLVLAGGGYFARVNWTRWDGFERGLFTGLGLTAYAAMFLGLSALVARRAQGSARAARVLGGVTVGVASLVGLALAELVGRGGAGVAIALGLGGLALGVAHRGARRLLPEAPGLVSGFAAVAVLGSGLFGLLPDRASGGPTAPLTVALVGLVACAWAVVARRASQRALDGGLRWTLGLVAVGAGALLAVALIDAVGVPPAWVLAPVAAAVAAALSGPSGAGLGPRAIGSLVAASAGVALALGGPQLEILPRVVVLACAIAATAVLGRIARDTDRSLPLWLALTSGLLVWFFLPAPFRALVDALMSGARELLGYRDAPLPVAWYGLAFLPYLALVRGLRGRLGQLGQAASRWLGTVAIGLSVLAAIELQDARPALLTLPIYAIAFAVDARRGGGLAPAVAARLGALAWSLRLALALAPNAPATAVALGLAGGVALAPALAWATGRTGPADVAARLVLALGVVAATLIAPRAPWAVGPVLAAGLALWLRRIDRDRAAGPELRLGGLLLLGAPCVAAPWDPSLPWMAVLAGLAGLLLARAGLRPESRLGARVEALATLAPALLVAAALGAERSHAPAAALAAGLLLLVAPALGAPGITSLIAGPALLAGAGALAGPGVGAVQLVLVALLAGLARVLDLRAGAPARTPAAERPRSAVHHAVAAVATLVIGVGSPVAFAQAGLIGALLLAVALLPGGAEASSAEAPRRDGALLRAALPALLVLALGTSLVHGEAPWTTVRLLPVVAAALFAALGASGLLVGLVLSALIVVVGELAMGWRLSDANLLRLALSATVLSAHGLWSLGARWTASPLQLRGLRRSPSGAVLRGLAVALAAVSGLIVLLLFASGAKAPSPRDLIFGLVGVAFALRVHRDQPRLGALLESIWWTLLSVGVGRLAFGPIALGPCLAAAAVILALRGHARSGLGLGLLALGDLGGRLESAATWSMLTAAAVAAHRRRPCERRGTVAAVTGTAAAVAVALTVPGASELTLLAGSLAAALGAAELATIGGLGRGARRWAAVVRASTGALALGVALAEPVLGLDAALLGAVALTVAVRASRRALDTGRAAHAWCAELGVFAAALVLRGWIALDGWGPWADGLYSLVGAFAFAAWAARHADAAPAVTRVARRTALALPLVAALVTGDAGLSTSAVLLAASATWAALGRIGPFRASGLLSALAFDAALAWGWWQVGVSDPQLYVLPVTASVLVLVELYRRELGETARAQLRAWALGVAYLTGLVSSIALDTPASGLVLAVACVIGLGLGAALRIRSYAVLGAGFLAADLAVSVARFGLRGHGPATVVLTGLGLVVLATMVTWSLHRSDWERRARRLRDELASWAA